MRDRKYVLAIAGIMLLSLVIACGEKPPSSQPTPSAQPTPPATQPAAQPTSTTPTAGAALTADEAKPIFQKNCIPCHGADGKGNKAISPKMPDFTDAKWQAKEKDEELVTSITNGIGQGKGSMPAWKGKLKDEEIQGLVAYVRTYAK
jgi:mono/diheme cytochrome c family protein